MQITLLPPWRRVRSVRRNAIATGWIVLACFVFAGSASAQSDARVSIAPRIPTRLNARASGPGVLRADANRVLISTTVTDPYGRPVQGLHKQDFRLLEDGIEKDLSDFFIEDGPISIGVVLDVSASIRNKLAETQQTIAEFLGLSLPGDEFFLVTFRDQPELVRGFTTDPKDIEADLAGIQPSGWTALYDAMVLAINHMKRASRSRRVLLVLTDGGDNNSRYSQGEVKDLIREANVRILSISIQGHTPVLDKLAAESGGRAYQARKLEELPDVAAAAGAEAHAQYVLGFIPPVEIRDGKYHTVKVEVVPPVADPRLHVSWRRGYYAPLP
jgi:Ca-activated chloride channel family protein